MSRSAQIRSSTAVVAADLLEVNRGDVVDILDSVDIPDPSDNSKKERWYRARAHDQDKQIADLEVRAAKLKEQTTTTGGSAWDWTSQKAQDAWNSEFSQDARLRFQKCWTDLKTSNK